jgi:lipopolysaccharide export system ATP-binding protein
LGYLPQRPTVFRRLSVADNLSVATRDAGRAAELLERFGLAHLAADRGATLSGGERRRVELARAFAAEPTVLLVDEPFAALDPKSSAEVADHLRQLADAGVGILLTDHDARQTLVACDRVYIVDRGVLLVEGTPQEVAADPRVRNTYLGDDFVTNGRE